MYSLWIIIDERLRWNELSIFREAWRINSITWMISSGTIGHYTFYVILSAAIIAVIGVLNYLRVTSGICGFIENKCGYVQITNLSKYIKYMRNIISKISLHINGTDENLFNIVHGIHASDIKYKHPDMCNRISK